MSSQISTGIVSGAPGGTAQAIAADVCSITNPASWWYQRFGSCFKDLVATYTLVNSNGATTGTATMTVTGSMTLNPTSSTWSELLTVKVTNTTGSITSLDISMDAGCDAPCAMSTPSPWAGPRTLAMNQSASGTVTYTDSPASGAQDRFSTKYHMYVVATGAIPTQPNYNWTNPRQIRCDRAVGSSAGCVYPDIKAQLVLPLSQYGAAAATYGWAQNNLIDHWGAADSPLHRIASEATADANRNATCYTPLDPFIPFGDSVVVDDSCDEFPFARTLEGGTTGSMCADVVPLLQNGVWTFYQANNAKPVTFNEPCIRGHVPELENKAAGGKLGSFAQTDRVMDLEGYTVLITQ
ncbi:hypothetical protein GA0074694_2142 [Micromonospora inyonensis]|uniref:Deoxyribonuclease NucA/NucB domain-containing protein n=2 Tax=Micromonospora inyonensis TaxID=47866 RepID=A0A1C6RLB5_9ACTN|nr:hypothetical protein GA0074694_2142 [Micromonospora inyonensis]